MSSGRKLNLFRVDVLKLVLWLIHIARSGLGSLLGLPNSCAMQKFHIGSDLDSDPLIEMYGIGMDICPQDGYLSLKWVQ